MNAEHYIRQYLGDLMVKLAVAQEEIDTLKAELAKVKSAETPEPRVTTE